MFDSHVHVVAGDLDRFPLDPVGLPNGAWYLTRAVDVEGLEATIGAADVHGAVLVQAHGAYGYDNSYVLHAARTRGHVVVGIPKPHDPSSIGRLVADGCQGVRLFDIPAGTHPDLATGVASAAENGVVAVVTVFADRIPAVAAVARSHPQVDVVVDHCGFVDLDDPEAREMVARECGDLQNLYWKVTSHVLLHCESPVATLGWLVSQFGTSRLLWGSDFPQTPDVTYRELVALAHEACAELSAPQQNEFLGGTSCKLWPMLLR